VPASPLRVARNARSSGDDQASRDCVHGRFERQVDPVWTTFLRRAEASSEAQEGYFNSLALRSATARRAGPQYNRDNWGSEGSPGRAGVRLPRPLVAVAARSG